jgi:hypothetical protein
MSAKNTRRYRERHEVEQSLEKYKGVEGIDYVECEICGKRGLYIDVRHLKTRHGLTKEEYIKLFPDALLNSEKKLKAQARLGNKSNTGRRFSKSHKRAISLSRTNGIPWTEREVEDFKEYRAIVRYYSNLNFNEHYWKINPGNFKRGQYYHLDHIVSVVEGFRKGIDPKVISEVSNLQILTATDNLSKGAK